MWLQMLISRDDLGAMLDRFLPITIDLGSDRTLRLARATAFALVPDIGVRVTTAAELRWPLAGIGTSVTVPSLELLLRPHVRRVGEVDVLAVGVEIEDAQIQRVPELLEPAIVGGLNVALQDRALTWDFSAALQHRFHRFETLAEIAALTTRVSWGEHRITAEGLVLAVSLGLDVERTGEASAQMP